MKIVRSSQSRDPQKKVRPWDRKIYWVLVFIAAIALAIIESKVEPTTDIFVDFIVAFIVILLLTSLWEKQLADRWKSTPVKK